MEGWVPSYWVGDSGEKAEGWCGDGREMTARGREGRLHRRFWRLRLPPRRLLPRPPSVASSGVIAWHVGARGREEARHPGTTHGRGDVCEGVKGGEEVLGAAVCLLQLLRRRSRRITRLLLHRCAPLARVAALVPALASCHRTGNARGVRCTGRGGDACAAGKRHRASYRACRRRLPHRWRESPLRRRCHLVPGRRAARRSAG